MAIAFYFDENVSANIIRALLRRGIDVLIVQKDLGEHIPDSIVFERATTLLRVTVSNDEDFLRLATERQHAGVSFPGVIFFKQRVVPMRQCIEDLELLSMAGIPEDFADRVIFLPFR